MWKTLISLVLLMFLIVVMAIVGSVVMAIVVSTNNTTIGYGKNVVVNTPDGLAVVSDRRVTVVYSVNMIDGETGKVIDKLVEYSKEQIKEFNLTEGGE